MTLGAFSRGILRIPFLEVLLGAEVVPRWAPGFADRVSAIIGWGYKPTTDRARAYAARHGLPYLALEDGFLRSHGTGDRFPPLSLVVDDQGIYYDSTRPSALEGLLNADADPLLGIAPEVARARAALLERCLSKYNQASRLAPGVLRADDRERVLVVDQTYQDMSVSLGQADETTFLAMLAAARTEHPQATIYVKTHPEVTSGRKAGYLTAVPDDARTVVLRQALNPLDLVKQMDRVYVVTSTMGFEALLAGKPVTVFGVPWYAGWGLTEDRQTCPRRTRRRSVEDLFAAAYFHYTRYLNPVTYERGTIFDAIDWLARQREVVERLPRRFVAVGFRRWKAAQLRPILAMAAQGAAFVKDAAAAGRLEPRAGDGLAHWGLTAPAGLEALAAAAGARLCHIEDGFYRSVGLGSDLIRPHSLVIDEQGLYFDSHAPSGLEQLLNTAVFTEEEQARARAARALIVRHGLTKYNLESRAPVAWPHAGRPVVLAPGQVEDDASILRGCESVRTNLGLLQAARAACPEAFIVYKPHPDVASGNRRGHVPPAEALRHADWVEQRASVVACLAAAEAVHTMTSMTGFEALLRGKQVVTYGRPFYAGWGLTHDHLAIPRRTRRLTLDELTAGVLLRYPLYWDWTLRGFTTCEAVLLRLIAERDALEASGGLAKLHAGYLRRQLRKLRALLRAWIDQGSLKT